jgi:hypothetical protein
MNSCTITLTLLPNIPKFDGIACTILVVFAAASIIFTLKYFTSNKVPEPAIYFPSPSGVTMQELTSRMPESDESENSISVSRIKPLNISFSDDFGEPLCEYVAPTIIPASITKKKPSTLFRIQVLPSFRRRISRIKPNPNDQDEN